LSQDEIVFEEVRYREPERMCRPDRDRRFACLAYELAAPEDLPIFLERRTADAIERHALRDTSVELGGILLGKECLDEHSGQPFVWVTESLEAQHYENTQASFTYTHDSWEEITRQRDLRHPELDIVGWYHTHPDFGIFLSGHDLFIHHHFFAQRLQVAYVVDPIRQTRGFFQWRGEAVAQVGGYFITAPREERIALARLVNDLENIPSSTSSSSSPSDGGGGLSPRLEAELIAMLTRPAAPPPTTTERTLTAFLFSMLGMMAGALGVLAVLWLIQLSRNIQDEHSRIDSMAQSIERAGAAQRLALETLLSTARSTEHDPDAFITQYTKKLHEIDESRRKLDQQTTINEALATRLSTADAATADLKKKLEWASAEAKKYEKDAKETEKLREQVADLSATNGRQARKLAEQDEVLDSVDAEKARKLLRRYDQAWYTAAAGWVVALFLALGLLAAFGLKPPSESEESPPSYRSGSGGSVEETPPHHIT
jgi:proteasome lid subunit RPN8/RPN11